MNLGRTELRRRATRIVVDFAGMAALLYARLPCGAEAFFFSEISWHRHLHPCCRCVEADPDPASRVAADVETSGDTACGVPRMVSESWAHRIRVNRRLSLSQCMFRRSVLDGIARTPSTQLKSV